MGMTTAGRQLPEKPSMEVSDKVKRIRELRQRFAADLDASENNTTVVQSREEALAAIRAERSTAPRCDRVKGYQPEGDPALAALFDHIELWQRPTSINDDVLLRSRLFDSKLAVRKRPATAGARTRTGRLISTRSPFGCTRMLATAVDTHARGYYAPRQVAAAAHAQQEEATVVTAATTHSAFFDRLYGHAVEHPSEAWRADFSTAIERRVAKRAVDAQFFDIYR
jgi:hypothetical protein